MHSSCEHELERFAQICQVLAGHAIDWCEPPDLTVLAEGFRTIGSPSVQLHALAMEAVLVPFAAGLARTIHRNFHARFSSPNKVVTQPSLQPIRDTEGRLLILESVLRWARDYREQFTMAHNSPAQRVRKLIEASQGRMSTSVELADAVGVGRRTLERQFRQEIGVSIREYRTRQRLSGAIRQLHGTSECVEAVALGAGWSSKKGFYDALNDVVGRTPGDVRRMSVPEIDGLISELNARGPGDELGLSA